MRTCFFYKFVCSSENFIYLNCITVLYPKIAEMILEHVTESQENYNQMDDYFERQYKIFQYACATLFPKFYTAYNACGINLCVIYVLKFKEWMDRKKQKREKVGKGAEIFVKRKEINKFEQKPISITDDKNKKLKLEAEEKN